MPLARIITDVADDCLELTMQLRARGFQVETVSPTDVPSTQADLEVRLEECAPEDVVIHASNGVSAEDLWVYVAPGALDSNSHPIRTIPLSTGSMREHLSASSKVLSIIAKQKTDRPPVVGALAIDSHEEDPILAELRDFPTAQAAPTPIEQLSAILVEIPDLVRPSALPVAKAPAAVENGQPVKASPEKAISEKPSVEAPPVKWLVDPEKTVARSPSLSIPIAPEPVRATISLPSQHVRRPARRKIRWNFQPLQVACGLSILAVIAWMLILLGRPSTVATLGQARTALPASKLAPVATQSADKTSVAHSPAQQKAPKPAPTKVQDAVAVARTVPAARPDESAGARIPKVHHDDGFIAADTVIFYDGRRPGPPRAKVQSEPSVKHYSDQN
jgi:hypothetical protein